MNIIKYLQTHPSHRYRVGEVYKYLMDHFDIHPNVEVEWHTLPNAKIQMHSLRPPTAIKFSWNREVMMTSDIIEHVAYCRSFGYPVLEGFNAYTFFRCGYFWKRETLSFYRYEDGRDYFQRYL